MTPQTHLTRANPHALLLSCALAAACMFWQGWRDFSLRDEGFLWYGVQRALLGEVPLRDFMSYDPAKYYWAAAWMAPFGADGIIALRWTLALTQAIGLFWCLWALARVPRMTHALGVLAALCLTAWMFPLYRMADLVTALCVTAGFSWWIQSPSRWRYFTAGVLVGAAGVVGRNHGLYAAIAAAGISVHLALGAERGKGTGVKWLVGVLGVAVGYSPMWIAMCLVPGLAEAVFRGVARTVERGTTNLTLPWAWPWRVDFRQPSQGLIIRDLLISFYFCALFLWVVTVPTWLCWRRYRGERKPWPPLAVAGSWMCVGYLHYAASRADAVHIAPGALVLLLTLFSLAPACSARTRSWGVTGLVVTSLYATLSHHPGWLSRTQGWVQTQVGQSRLWLHPSDRREVELLTRLQAEFAPGGEPFLAVPYWPGAYALLRTRSPMRANYALWAPSAEDQVEEIRRIQQADPRFVVLVTTNLDGSPKRSFAKTHPLVDTYLRNCFRQLHGYTREETVLVFIPAPKPVTAHLYKDTGCAFVEGQDTEK